MSTPDLLKATDETLAGLAAIAFRLGLADGRRLSKPRDSKMVMAAVGLATSGSWRVSFEDCEYRIFHREKLRQVYGAGFDIAKMTAKAEGVS